MRPAQQALRQAIVFRRGKGCVVEEPIPHATSDQVVVQSTLSAISAGTEKAVLLGCLGAEEVDEGIAGMAGERAGDDQPLRYGYQLVGRAEGKRVFAFHPHATHAVVPREAVHSIPPDIPDGDAVLLANGETAVSLVHDAAPLIGSTVAVFGGGTVGQLTAAILARHGFAVHLFDPVLPRVQPLLSAFPQVYHGGHGPFDVSIEVSGAPSALRTALSLTRRHGRIVVGSWYREEDMSLPLGLSFHRSHIEIKASQVTEIPPPLRGRWTKERRFGVVWDELRALRPSEWLPTATHTLAEVAEVYEALLRGPGDTVQHCFAYAG